MPSTNKKNRGKGKKQKAEKKQYNSTKSKCTGCDKIGEDFKVCSACKLAKYCTSSCQHAHWPEHKRTCKVLALNFMGLGKPKLRFKVGGEILCLIYHCYFKPRIYWIYVVSCCIYIKKKQIG